MNIHFPLHAGKVVVDSFGIPSACVCHFKEEAPFGLRKAPTATAAAPGSFPMCSTKTEELELKKEEQQQQRARLEGRRRKAVRNKKML